MVVPKSYSDSLTIPREWKDIGLKNREQLYALSVIAAVSLPLVPFYIFAKLPAIWRKNQIPFYCLLTVEQ
ncbi:hypothetical protein CEXT_770151 [Caerostris extrusa]|uniref:Uncharacterized protein n=1 Tax=Caerostris extrusa TaxID=172846 RepID=A0AAV4PA79_CAEEX|nr:hypothetical protein CEXT_770151 [Caerostris extrusa]